MNKEFIRPLIIVVMATLMIGLIAWLVPAKEAGVIKVKKMTWFERLYQKQVIAKADTLIAAEAATLASDLMPIKSFIAKLNNPKANLRIAYFGDSIIEGDLITGKLRQDLQASHGGTGVGLVPITSIVAGFRQTIKHNFSKNWESISFMTPHSKEVSLGFTGFTFIPRNYYVSETTIEAQKLDSLAVMDSSLVATPKPQKKTARVYVNNAPWVEYIASPVAGGASAFTHIRLFYSNATDSSIVKVSLDGSSMQTKRLSNGSGVQVLSLNETSPVNKIKLEFSAHDPIHVYGVSFDEPQGAYVDNFPIRGYSGMYFQRIHNDILKGFQRYLNYDLIVLQYGENVSDPKITDYSYYERGMKNTIKHIQSALPDVPILMISAHDRSIKINGSYRTSPDIPYIVKTQSNVAKAMNVGFWNLFAAMGGIDSMPNYVSHQPAWAGKDYTHFTRSGGIQIATMLLKYLKGID